MGINLHPALKPFEFILDDLGFILRQVTFQPLDASGHAITPPLDANGNPLPGSIVYNPDGTITVTVTLPDSTTAHYTYASAYDPVGLRNVSGAFNNLLPGQSGFGNTFSAFLRQLGPGYGNYLGQYAPPPGEADSAAHPFASALDPTLHHFGAAPVAAQPDYAIAPDLNGNPVVHTVIDYTPRMISQTIASQAALVSTGIPTATDTFNATPFIGNLATTPGDASYSGWFVLFGQFFDHGIDFIDKGGNIDPVTGKSAQVVIPLATSDPLYAIAPGHQMSIGRATVEGFDSNGNAIYTDHTSPFIDQSQTYGSLSAITNLLREWVEDPNNPGTFLPGMHLFDGHSLAQDWTRWDGVSTDQTLPTLTELRIEVHQTQNAALGRTDITYADVFDYHNSGEPLLLDFLPVADGIDTTSNLNIFGDGPNILKGVDLNSILILAPKDPNDPNSPTLVLGAKPGADPALVAEAMMQALGAHYIAGDGRANENFGLTSLHHVFHEEHNYQIDNLVQTMETALADGSYNPTQIHAWQIAVAGPGNTPLTDSIGNYIDTHGAISWDQNKMFNAAKLVVEMEYQHIAVDQYAHFISPDLPDFDAYDTSRDPGLSLEYSQAAFRFGHSQLRETIDAIDPSGGITGKVLQYALANAFLNPTEFAAVGPGAIALGMSHQLGGETDEFVTTALQQSLLGQPQDLPAINIARGRDVGLPTLNQARAEIYATMGNNAYTLSGDLTPYTSWNDFGANMIHPESLVNFIAAYSFDGDLAAAQAAMTDSTFMSGGDQGFQKIDLWIGGLAEKHVDGGILGATFNAIFVDQIDRLQDGDRLYYIFRLDSALPETTNFGNQLFTEQFKDLVERTTGVHHLTGDIFLHADSYLELGDTPNATELAARGTAADAHKYGDLVSTLHLGVYSTSGVDNALNGSLAGNSYIIDIRPDGPAGPDGVTPLNGFNASEVIGGTPYDDLIDGGGGVDTLYGDDGNDQLNGDDGNDHVYGGNGNDAIDGGGGDDLLDGGDGNDLLFGGFGDDVVLGGAGTDVLFGAEGDDEMFGNAGDDIMYGGEGNNLMYGDDGADTLIGGTGDDLITGGHGDDIIIGGGGLDTAIYSGNRADYVISYSVSGGLIITDTRAGSPEGSDTLEGVKILKFADAAFQMPSGFDADGDYASDLLYGGPSGDFFLAAPVHGSIQFSGYLGSPGPNWQLVSTGDYDGDSNSDLLFKAKDGTLENWLLSGSSVLSANVIGNPGPDWTVVGSADFNGDGKADILFRNVQTGYYGSWDSDGRAIIGGGTINTPREQWAFRALGDFNGDGKGDILFQKADGTYGMWMLDDTALLASGDVGNAGPGWFFKGTGDFNSDGKTDILFENTQGLYATWDMDGTRIVGGGTLGNPGAAWTLLATGDYNGDGYSDLLFRNIDGSNATWALNDTTIIVGGVNLGKTSYGYNTYTLVATTHPADPYGMLVFQDTLTSSTQSWVVGSGLIIGGGNFDTTGLQWTAIATGDFGGTGETDVLYRDAAGNLATWVTDGTSKVAGGFIGNPGSAWAAKAVADFNGDGKSDILFYDAATHSYATWDISGHDIVGGQTIYLPWGTGQLGSSFVSGNGVGPAGNGATDSSFVAATDIDGDGKADLILHDDVTGDYWAWGLDDGNLASLASGPLGNPGGTWAYAGTGDFNGDGRADLLFKDAGGDYASWDLAGFTQIGGGTIGNPGGTYQLAKIADLNQDGMDDLVFEDATGIYASWLMSDTAIIGGATLGMAGTNLHVI